MLKMHFRTSIGSVARKVSGIPTVVKVFEPNFVHDHLLTQNTGDPSSLVIAEKGAVLRIIDIVKPLKKLTPDDFLSIDAALSPIKRPQTRI